MSTLKVNTIQTNTGSGVDIDSPLDSIGEDVSDDCEELQAVATALWSPEVIAAYQESLESSRAL